MSHELEFSKDPAIRVAPELARPGVAVMGDPEDDEEEEEEEEKKKPEEDEDEDDENEDGEKEEPLRMMSVCGLT
jgi:hypothetical protein